MIQLLGKCVITTTNGTRLYDPSIKVSAPEIQCTLRFNFLVLIILNLLAIRFFSSLTSKTARNTYLSFFSKPVFYIITEEGIFSLYFPTW